MSRRKTEPAAHEAENPLGPVEYGDLLAALKRIGAEREWVVEGAIESNPIIVLTGPEKKHKSFIGTDLAVAVATGTKWLGAFQVREPGDVVIVDGEYGVQEWSRRVKRICAGRGLDAEAVVRRLRYFDAKFGFMLSHLSVEYAQIAEDIRRNPPALVILDPFRNFLDGDEISAKDIIAAMRLINNLRCLGNCPVLVTHHLTKTGGMSGSRAIRSRADMLIEGSDDDQPWYSATGRTIRSGDPIAKRFTVRVEHEDDDDDRIAKTRLLLRFSGESGEKGPLSKPAQRLHAEMKKRIRPASANDLGKAAGVLNGRGRSKAMRDLADLGLAVETKAGWEVSTTEFFGSIAPGQSKTD
ncbi:MAG: AAA family ATPase [Labilithrix sp.]|nr:AAA family ATPase [Labilithrix sp.]